MRLKAKSLLTVFSMAFLCMLALLSAAGTAHAQTLLDTHTENGVTCKKYTAQTSWPTYFWNCDASVTPATARNVTNGANALPTKFRSTLSGHDVYVFANAADFAAYTGTDQLPANAMGGVAAGVAGYPNIAAAFTTAVQNGATVNLSTRYRNTIVQSLARVLYRSSLYATWDIDARFPAALTYDSANMDEVATPVLECVRTWVVLSFCIASVRLCLQDANHWVRVPNLSDWYSAGFSRGSI